VQSVIAAEVGHLDLAYDYLGEAALMDLYNLEHNTRDGLHIASLAGTWIALVAGFGGMRDHGGRLAFRPRLPEAITGLAFNLFHRGQRLRVEITPEAARYSLAAGLPIDITHHGQPASVRPGERLELSIPPIEVRPAPPQPPGRAPAARRRSAEN
jgi:alpha,alpha-trehalose phosphorylase